MLACLQTAVCIHRLRVSWHDCGWQADVGTFSSCPGPSLSQVGDQETVPSCCEFLSMDQKFSVLYCPSVPSLMHSLRVGLTYCWHVTWLQGLHDQDSEHELPIYGPLGWDGLIFYTKKTKFPSDYNDMIPWNDFFLKLLQVHKVGCLM